VLGAKDRKQAVAVGVDPLYGWKSSGGCKVALAGDIFGKIDGQKAGNETLQKIQDVCDWWYVVPRGGKGSGLGDKGLKAIGGEEGRGGVRQDECGVAGWGAERD
jgi:hypothetical protein